MKVTDVGLTALHNLPLKQLDFSDVGCGDSQVGIISQMNTICKLKISNEATIGQITDVGLKYLSERV